MIKVSVVGAKGRMGSHVVDAVNAAADTELALALDTGDLGGMGERDIPAQRRAAPDAPGLQAPVRFITGRVRRGGEPPGGGWRYRP